MIPRPPQPARFDLAWRRAALAIAVIAGVFCVTIAIQLAREHFAPMDAARAPDLPPLKKQVSADPQDQATRQRIRALDVQIRREDLRRRSLADMGAWLLLGGVVLMWASLKVAMAYRVEPVPIPAPDAAATASVTAADAKQRRVGRRAVMGTGVAILVGSLLAAAALEPPRPWRQGPESLATKGDAPASPSARPPPTVDAIARNWPRFRGPQGAGVALVGDVPTQPVVMWKTAIPLPGHNSPVVWGDRLFLTGADRSRCEVYCFDANDGRLLWQRPVAQRRGGPGEGPETYSDTGYAAPTMAVDGRYAFAAFSLGELACLDWAGNILWHGRIDTTGNTYGHASSLELWHDLLIVQNDRGHAGNKQSSVRALDARTGKVVWEAPQPVGESWASPIVVETGTGPQLVTAANPLVIAYEPATGRELWRADCLNGEVTPSPIVAGGLVVVVKPSSELIALRTNETGDITERGIAWRGGDSVPDICSPVANGELLFALSSEGVLVCYEIKTGTILWKHDFDAAFRASPSIAGDRLYLLSEKGVMFIVAAARQFSPIAQFEIGEPCTASPAFVNGYIYVRGARHLFALSAKPGGRP